MPLKDREVLPTSERCNEGCSEEDKLIYSKLSQNKSKDIIFKKEKLIYMSKNSIIL